MKAHIENVLAWVFGTIFLALAAVVTVETLSRKVFNISLQGADELGGYALAVGSTIAFSLALMGRNHIRVDVFHEMLPRAGAGLPELVLDRAASPRSASSSPGSPPRSSPTPMHYGSTAQTPWATPLIWPQSVWYAGLVIFALVATGYALRATVLLVTRPHRHAEPRLPSEEREGRTQGRTGRPGAAPGGRRSQAMSLAASSGSPSRRCWA